MQVPALVETIRQRMSAVIVMQLPRAVDSVVVFCDLLAREIVAAMFCDRHDVRRSVREPDARPAKRDLHHAPGKIARRMKHVLVCGRDRAAGSVIVRPKMSPRAASLG